MIENLRECPRCGSTHFEEIAGLHDVVKCSVCETCWITAFTKEQKEVIRKAKQEDKTDTYAEMRVWDRLCEHAVNDILRCMMASVLYEERAKEIENLLKSA